MAKTESRYRRLEKLRPKTKVAPQPELRPRRRLPRRAPLLILEIAVLAAYSNSFRADLVADSATVILKALLESNRPVSP